jgi:GTP-binding protein HflX
VAVSATSGEGLPRLTEAIEKTLSQSLYRMHLRVPYERGDLVAELHNMAAVQNQTHEEDGVYLTVRVPPAMYDRFKPYRIPG